MIDPSPLWEFTARHALTQWYGHVRLLPERVLGQWFCLNRGTGRRLWERRFFRPNAVIGVDAGVLVASEMRSDGPWTFDFGVYGISLDTGDLLWTAHRRGAWGRLVRLLDFVPVFTNELRDRPLRVGGGECVCESGRVLDVKTGRDLRRVSREEARVQDTPDGWTELRVAEDALLTFRSGDRPNQRVRGKLRVALVRNDGTEGWEFDLASTGRQPVCHRFCPAVGGRRAVVYFVVSDEPNTKPHPTRRYYALPNRTAYHLLALDVNTGQVVQDVPLGEADRECRIEDVDDAGLLISSDGRRLRYFERVAG